SPQQDFQCNSADSLFFRIVTQKAIDTQERLSTKDNLGGCLQIILKTDVFNFLGTCAVSDSFGFKNRDAPQLHLRHQHANRPKFLKFIQSLQKRWHYLNEFMIKNYLDPSYIVGVTYQDPRKILAKDLEHLIPGFFAHRTSLEEKANYISDNQTQIQKIL